MLAALFCWALTFSSVFPVSTIAFNAVTGGKLIPHSLVEICIIFLLWCSFLVGYAGFILPFMVARWSGLWGDYTYEGVAYDYLCFVTFVPSPMILTSGIFKMISTKNKWKWNWRQRAVLGSSKILIVVFFWLGQFYVRPDTFTLTLWMSLAFYMYCMSTYLPAQPEGEGPEVTGSRMWPSSRTWGWWLWDPAIQYLGMKVIFDGDEKGGKEDDASTAVKAKLRAKLRSGLVSSQAELAGVLKSLGEHCNDIRVCGVRRILQEQASKLGVMAEEADDSTNEPSLYPNDAAIMGFHPHGIIPYR
jgi:hypothetical protein